MEDNGLAKIISDAIVMTIKPLKALATLTNYIIFKPSAL